MKIDWNTAMASLQKEIADLRTQRDAALKCAEELRARVLDLEMMLNSRDGTIAALRARVAKLQRERMQ